MKPGPENARSLRQKPTPVGTATLPCDSGRLTATRPRRQPASGEFSLAIVRSMRVALETVIETQHFVPIRRLARDAAINGEVPPGIFCHVHGAPGAQGAFPR